MVIVHDGIVIDDYFRYTSYHQQSGGHFIFSYYTTRTMENLELDWSCAEALLSLNTQEKSEQIPLNFPSEDFTLQGEEKKNVQGQFPLQGEEKKNERGQFTLQGEEKKNVQGQLQNVLLNKVNIVDKKLSKVNPFGHYKDMNISSSSTTTTSPLPFALQNFWTVQGPVNAQPFLFPYSSKPLPFTLFSVCTNNPDIYAQHYASMHTLLNTSTKTTRPKREIKKPLTEVQVQEIKERHEKKLLKMLHKADPKHQLLVERFIQYIQKSDCKQPRTQEVRVRFFIRILKEGGTLEHMINKNMLRDCALKFYKARNADSVRTYTGAYKHFVEFVRQLVASAQ